jgi:hypothetical protein
MIKNTRTTLSATWFKKARERERERERRDQSGENGDRNSAWPEPPFALAFFVFCTLSIMSADFSRQAAKKTEMRIQVPSLATTRLQVLTFFKVEAFLNEHRQVRVARQKHADLLSLVAFDEFQDNGFRLYITFKRSCCGNNRST